jgi:hypothetical protein
MFFIFEESVHILSGNNPKQFDSFRRTFSYSRRRPFV